MCSRITTSIDIQKAKNKKCWVTVYKKMQLYTYICTHLYTAAYLNYLQINSMGQISKYSPFTCTLPILANVQSLYYKIDKLFGRNQDLPPPPCSCTSYCLKVVLMWEFNLSTKILSGINHLRFLNHERIARNLTRGFHLHHVLQLYSRRLIIFTVLIFFREAFRESWIWNDIYIARKMKILLFSDSI